MKGPFRSLALKVGVVVILVQTVIFVSLGMFYSYHFNLCNDQAFAARVNAAVQLVSRGMLALETMSDPELLRNLMGDDLMEGMVVSADGIVFHAMEQSRVGKHVWELRNIDPEWFTRAAPDGLIEKHTQDGEQYLVCIAPLHAHDGSTPFLYAYFKASTRKAVHDKTRLMGLFLIGSLTGVVVTSLVILLMFRRLVFTRLSRTADTLKQVQNGVLEARIQDPILSDEIGLVQQGVNSTAASLETTVNSLRRERASLENRVEERTKELAQLNQTLEQDIRQRRRVEESLRMTNDQLQGVLDHSPSLIFLKDLSGNILMANKAMGDKLGREPDALLGQTARDLFGPEIGRAMEGDDQEVVRTRKPVTCEKRLSFSGKSTMLLITKFPLFGVQDKVWAICAIATDITESKRLQAESVRAAQLASLGELAASVAHEINNPVNGIINYAQLLIDSQAVSENMTNVPGKIITEGERVAAIVKSLLFYSRSRPKPKAPTRVIEILNESLSLTRTQLVKDGITLEQDMPEDLPRVLVSAQEIQQVFINLLANARHALNLRFPSVDPAKKISIQGRTISRNGTDQVEIVIRDNGTGMEPKVMKQVFEPFFTTKETGEGTGLGLPICREIINRYNGELTLNSIPMQGTEAIVVLPAYEEEEL